MDEVVTIDQWKEKLKMRIQRHQNNMNKFAEKLIARVDTGRMDRSFEFERERIWLESLAQEGEGLNLCCGHLSIGNSYGLDANRVFAADFILPVDKLDRFERDSFDFIISNHFESVNNPLNVLYAAHRILKPSGLLAFVFLDTDSEANSAENDDIMNSSKKVSLFSRSIMRRYLIKAGFTSIEVTESTTPRLLRVTARKGGEPRFD